MGDGHAVNLAFCPGDDPVDVHNLLAHFPAGIDVPHNMGDIIHTAVVVTVFVLFVTFHQHPHMGAANAAFFAFLGDVLHSGNTQAIQLRQNGILIVK